MQLIIEHNCHGSKLICKKFFILGWSLKVTGWKGLQDHLDPTLLPHISARF